VAEQDNKGTLPGQMAHSGSRSHVFQRLATNCCGMVGLRLGAPDNGCKAGLGEIDARPAQRHRIRRQSLQQYNGGTAAGGRRGGWPRPNMQGGSGVACISHQVLPVTIQSAVVSRCQKE
jgi:hypothetical protein